MLALRGEDPDAGRTGGVDVAFRVHFEAVGEAFDLAGEIREHLAAAKRAVGRDVVAHDQVLRRVRVVDVEDLEVGRERQAVRPIEVAQQRLQLPVGEPVHAVERDLFCRIVERSSSEEASRCIAREQIADRGAAMSEQAVAVRDPPHDLAGIFRVVRHHEALGLLVPPTKAGYPVVVPVENAGLARRGLCRQERFPPIERRAA